jgi:hypothetical protein
MGTKFTSHLKRLNPISCRRASTFFCLYLQQFASPWDGNAARAEDHLPNLENFL